MLFNTRNRSLFINKIVFSKAVDEINLMQTKGITITHPIPIFLVLALIRGDNLGIQTLFGLNECFRSTFFVYFVLQNLRISILPLRQ